nr:MAG TPA: hypothetical protein [Caudoviricetes sp.]
MGGLRLSADILPRDKSRPHGAFVCLLRQGIICTTTDKKSPCTFW